MEVLLELFQGTSPAIAVAILAIAALIYVYKDSKAERTKRQEIMDKQNEQWMGLYKENLLETAKVRDEISRTRGVISALESVISNLSDLILKTIK